MSAITMLISASCPYCHKQLGIQMNIEELNVMDSPKEREDKIRHELNKIKDKQKLDQAMQTIGTAPLGTVDRYKRFTSLSGRPVQHDEGGIVQGGLSRDEWPLLDSDPNPDKTMQDYANKKKSKRNTRT